MLPMFTDEEMEWSENVPSDFLVIVFFISFFLIVVWTMLPVVVAILLENFVQASKSIEANQLKDNLKISGVLRRRITRNRLVCHIM